MTTKAVDGITHLAREAYSESVQLRAWRAILADMMSVYKFSVLEYRMTEIEEEVDKRGQGHKVRTRSPAEKVNRMAEVEERLRERTGHKIQRESESAPGDGPCPRTGTFRPIERPALHVLAPRHGSMSDLWR